VSFREGITQLRWSSHEKRLVPSEYSPQDVAVMRAVSAMAAGLGLSDRQLELLTRLTRGLSRAEVAAEMGVTVAAVDYHGRVIRESCGLSPRELVLRLLRDALFAVPTAAVLDQAKGCGGEGTF